MSELLRYPGIRITSNGNTLVSEYVETRITQGGVFYPITSSTQMGEIYEASRAKGKLNVFGQSKIAIETEGEHAAQGGAIAYSVTGRRAVNFTSGQGIVYAVEQYYHAPGKLSTLVVQIGARALTKHALNVHCGHDDFNACLDVGWIMLMAKDAQQAADQAIIIRRVTELSLNPGMNIQDGFLTTHLERTFLAPEAELLREYLGDADDIIECPTPAQRQLFGPTRKRVPAGVDLKNPTLLGPVQNQEHYMNGVVARRNNFSEPILGFLEDAYADFAELTGRSYGMVSSYRTDDAKTVFVSLGSAAENIEAACDHLREQGESVGSVHINVLRPFPEAAVLRALAGKERIVVLERTSEPLSGDNPLGRDIRTAFSKALDNHTHGAGKDGLPSVAPEAIPELFCGEYGIGSRDFRPEGILGAYEYVTGKTSRQDGSTAEGGVRRFVIGIDHPHAVVSQDTPSLLPDKAISVRLHSIGGWGMVTTGKNLAAILGEFGDFLAQELGERDEAGRFKELVHISANPKYGSEKKGAPTAYFLVVAPERVRVNCDLAHVNVVLCCDPKAFTHMDPLSGLSPGGAFVWESDESPETAWLRIPSKAREEILEKKIRVFILPGFEIARKATDRVDLQLRMQGNSFLGAFFQVSTFLEDNGIGEDHFRRVVEAQYRKKFGHLGEGVIQSNMTVMTQGFERVQEIEYGAVDDSDRSSMRGEAFLPLSSLGSRNHIPKPAEQPDRHSMFQLKTFDGEYRAGHGYNQPASALASVGIMAAASGATSSKYVARRETPVFIAENCTQCMECISACPDTALPNTAQDISTVLATVARHYLEDPSQRKAVLDDILDIEDRVRTTMLAAVKAKDEVSFTDLVAEELNEVEGLTDESKARFLEVLGQLPMAYGKTTAIFRSPEKKAPGTGGLFSIFVSDLCKGCAECVAVCGDHEALVMAQETEGLNAEHETGIAFLDLLPDTPQKYLGLYDGSNPSDSRAAALRNHLMVRTNYDALVSGDGACAGCGEKTILRALATLTEAYMRPLYHAKASRLVAKAEQLDTGGLAGLRAFAARDAEGYAQFRTTVAHVLMALGGEDDADTAARIAEHGEISDEELVRAITTVMRQDAFNHRSWQCVDGRLANGMSVMAMGAHTGCNTVYGSTPPNNPHPYPWMNSLFQDGSTITWMFGESFMMDHGRRSVVPERLADVLLAGADGTFTADDHFDLCHMTDILMTDQEVAELPKAWAIGGDGGMGDIGFQNVSKVILQNRPNVKLLMLDTQVYSNTGGQNSDSSPMAGGFDMNQFGRASQGKMVEKKGLAEIFTSGHGSPFVGQVSMANPPKLYKAILDGLAYRGTAFFQCFTTCQPEHGVGDDQSNFQARLARDSRGLPEFVFDPKAGETYAECFDLKGNPSSKQDWWLAKSKPAGLRYQYTIAHWAATEARFRKHLKKVSEEEAKKGTYLDDMLVRLTMNDIVHRRHLVEGHRANVPNFRVYIELPQDDGSIQYRTLSRQLVLYCVERRKSWRLLQSRAGIRNRDYEAQRALLKKVDAGEIELSDFLSRSSECFKEELAALA